MTIYNARPVQKGMTIFACSGVEFLLVFGYVLGGFYHNLKGSIAMFIAMAGTVALSFLIYFLLTKFANSAFIFDDTGFVRKMNGKIVLKVKWEDVIHMGTFQIYDFFEIDFGPVFFGVHYFDENHQHNHFDVTFSKEYAQKLEESGYYEKINPEYEPLIWEFWGRKNNINTIPNGSVAVVSLSVLIVALILMGGVILPNPVGWWLILSAVLPACGLLILLCKKYYNIIEISESGVRHGKDFLAWERVCISAKCLGLHWKPGGRFAVFYIFFDDHFLTSQEAQAKATRKKGFYLVANCKRLSQILPFYHKRIKLLNRPQDARFQNILADIKEHNAKRNI